MSALAAAADTKAMAAASAQAARPVLVLVVMTHSPCEGC
jgi:hypothetical protein